MIIIIGKFITGLVYVEEEELNHLNQIIEVEVMVAVADVVLQEPVVVEAVVVEEEAVMVAVEEEQEPVVEEAVVEEAVVEEAVVEEAVVVADTIDLGRIYISFKNTL
jgi:hypothetical protein